MISTTKITFMVITLLIAFGFPIILGVIFRKKYNASVKAILIGALVFFIFQMVLRIPMLNVLSKYQWYINMTKNPLLYSIFLGLTAGLFEEIGRFLGFYYFLKDRLNYQNGLAFGVGHGGIEAILLVGFTYINNIIFSIFINKGQFDTLFLEKLSSEMITYIKNTLINTPDHVFLVAGIERIFAIIIQIALSILILIAVKERKMLFLIIAILLHTLIDTPLALLSMYGKSILLLETLTFIWAIASLVFIIKSKDKFEEVPYSYKNQL